MKRLGAALRQRRHHREFRIGPPAWDDVQRARLEQIVAMLSAAAAPAPPEQPVPEVPAPDAPAPLDEGTLAGTATYLWRAQQKLDSADEPASKQARQAGRYLRTARQALAGLGVVIQDHDNLAFHSGLALEVLVFQEDPALPSEVVLETVRPSVYFRDRLIQMGQVIVGGPERVHTEESRRA
ncbi:MAG: hypothetical protein DLM59_05610 [Pseudonocardiales bacterium]|nr:MAG: hypothetical protein DLM59_05610 [Pseudonocardiales bacterium]